LLELEGASLGSASVGALIHFFVHVHPGARQRSVRGSYDGDLDVHVPARAIDGAATKEVVLALAEAFGVSARAVHCAKGLRSRRKAITIDGDEQTLRRRLAELLAQS
jgi:uncharacterized protein YggU (UPF0235/DUF167 family)